METSTDTNKPTLPNNNRTDNDDKKDQKSDVNDGPTKEEKSKENVPEIGKEIPNSEEEAKNKMNSIEESDKAKSIIDNIISSSSQKEEKLSEKNVSKGEDKDKDNIAKDKESNPKEEEKEQKSEKDNPNDYIFPIVNNFNTKLEESKNTDLSSTYKISPNDFRSLNLNIPENFRPKNKNQSQNQNTISNSIFNMSHFNPITFSCSLNTHSVKKSKSKPIQKEQEFFEKIIKIADVSNINEFWEVFQHLKKPNQCPTGSDYHIFKKGIFPMWEDKLNMDGGKLSVLLTIKYANVIWEEVAFNFSQGLLPYYDYINGIVISMRPKFMVLSFWIKCGNNSLVEKIRNALSGLLQTPSSNCIDFIPFH